jgi:hypothetical protein
MMVESEERTETGVSVEAVTLDPEAGSRTGRRQATTSNVVCATDNGTEACTPSYTPNDLEP